MVSFMEMLGDLLSGGGVVLVMNSSSAGVDAMPEGSCRVLSS